jgi:pimeloyl-ACP methyl ester carboxylesterase
MALAMRRAPIAVAVPAAALAGVAAIAAGVLLWPSAERGDQRAAQSAGRSPLARSYRVNGRPMYIECRGAGTPVVILDAGLGVLASQTWAAVLPRLSARTRTCFYERPGIGRSAPAPAPRTSAAIVAELRALLRTAHVPGPYVLVGASFGGLNMQLMASEHPHDAAGVVLVDSLHADFDRRFSEVMGQRAAAERAAALAHNSEGIRFADLLESDRQVEAAPRFPAIPLRVLAHSDSFDPGGRPVARLERLWRRLQRALGQLSPQGEVAIVPGTTHRIAEDAPGAVAAAVMSEVSEIRNR